MNNEDYHKILGSVSFTFPNMKPPDGSSSPTVPGVVIYTPDIGNYLTAVEIELYTDQLNHSNNASDPSKELAIQVGVLVGPNGIIYHMIAMDYIRNETDNAPITIKSTGEFILTKRVLPYEETFDPADLNGGTQNTSPPPPVLRSGTCDYNYVADANVVFDHNNQETWLSSFGDRMKIGRNLLTDIFNRYPQFGVFYSSYGFVNINSAGWAARDTSVHKGVRSHFYKAEASLNSLPLELYQSKLSKIQEWRLDRPEFVDKYGADTHYALAYQFNRKGSYYRQGLDGNQWYPTNTIPEDHGKYNTILADPDQLDGNLLPYTSKDSFENALAPENLYDINLYRGIYSAFSNSYASPMIAGYGLVVNIMSDFWIKFMAYKYNIYVKSPIYREFMTGGRLGLYANFTDNFKIYKSLNPLCGNDLHTVYEGEQTPIEHTTSPADNNPSPISVQTLKSLKYFEDYKLPASNENFYSGLVAWGNTRSEVERMTHIPHTGFLPSLTFDVKWCSAADSKITYPIVDGESTDPAITPPEASVPDLVTTLLTNQVLQSTYSHNLKMTTSRDAINIDPGKILPCNLYKNINFFPISANVGIYNIPQKDSATNVPEIGSKLSNGSGSFDKYIYSCAVDGPVISTFSTPPSTSPSTPPPETRKILVCFGSDLCIKMVDHAKICNRCYNMVATTVCTASSMPSPILSNAGGSNSQNTTLSDFKNTTLSNMALAFVSSRRVSVKFGGAPPNPRNFYLDTFIKSTPDSFQGGFMNLPIIENTEPDPDWAEAVAPYAIFKVTPPIPIPDTRNVTAFRPWKDKIAYGFNEMIYESTGLVRSTIFDYAWNLSVDNGANGLPTAISSRGMKIRQRKIQDRGFIDMVGNVPMNTLNKRVMEAGLVHGGLYTKLFKSYVSILDLSMSSSQTMIGFRQIEASVTWNLNIQMTYNKADYVHGLVAAVLYNHTAGEIGVALGSGCSNISIYSDIINIGDNWGGVPPIIYNYYGYGATPHYIGLHPDGFYWIPTDIGYYIHKDPDVALNPVTKFAEEQEHEWCQPLLRTGFINTNVAPYCPTLPELVTTIIKIPDSSGQIKVKFSGSHIPPHDGSPWDCVPKVPASKIYQDTLFTVTGSYGQVTNGDSAYWQYVENFLIRDLTNETDLKTFNENN